jgi:hypothetical protein
VSTPLERDFLFVVRCSQPPPQFETMVADLAGSVLRHAGYAEPAIAELERELRSSVAGAAAAGACDLRFRAHAGELEIIVSKGGRPILHVSRPLP